MVFDTALENLAKEEKKFLKTPETNFTKASSGRFRELRRRGRKFLKTPETKQILQKHLRSFIPSDGEDGMKKKKLRTQLQKLF
jgi:hypothetical protein